MCSLRVGRPRQPQMTVAGRHRATRSVAAVIAALVAVPVAGAGGHVIPVTQTAPAGPPFRAMPAGAPLTAVTGTLRTVHGHARRGRVSYADTQLVTRRGRVLRLDTRALRRTPRGGSRVRVVGRLHRGVLRARRLTVLRRSVRARAAAAGGSYRTLVLPITFASAPSTPWSTATLRSRVFTATNSVRAYLEETSFGAVSLRGVVDPAGDVAPWQTISASTSTCAWSSWQSAARAAATAAGWTLSSYDRILYVMGNVASCGWSGLAPYPSGGWVHLNGTTLFGVFAHELGHTFGLDHASTLSCTSGGQKVWVSGTCTTDEYGDPFDPMGDAWAGRWFHAFSRRRLGWLSSAQTPQVTSSGTYDLLPAGGGGEGPRALTIPRGDGSSYHLELRRPTGIFDAFSLVDWVVGGVSVRLVPTSVQGSALPQLLDTTPQTATFADAALGSGRQVTDATRKITIETLAVGEQGAQVRLWVGEDPVTDPAPPSPPPAPAAPVPDPASPAPAAEPPSSPGAPTPPAVPDPTASADDPVPPVDPAPTPGTSDPSGPATGDRVALRLSASATTRRSAVGNGILVRLRSGLDCPCAARIDVRDGRGRTVGSRRVRIAASTHRLRVRLRAAARRRIARASRAMTLRVRVTITEPERVSRSARVRLR